MCSRAPISMVPLLRVRASCSRRLPAAAASRARLPCLYGRSRALSSVCFSSDNCRGALPEVLQAVVDANAPSSVPSYGADDLTAQAADAVRGWLGCHPEAAVVPTISGIASDVLGLTPYANPTTAVYVHEVSHMHLWQCGAAGFYTGAMLKAIGGKHGKIDPAQLAEALAASTKARRAVYQPSAAVVSVTQPTEAGTLYTIEELKEICDIAHSHGVSVHMDGARLANAVVALGCTPAEITWEAGVDVLALGTTKGGTLAAEAVVFFNPEGTTDINRYFPDTSDVPMQSVAGPLDMDAVGRRRKRAGHELSKNRFVAAQILAYFGTDLELWRRSATHANNTAGQLASKLEDRRTKSGVDWEWQHPVDTNQLFLSFPDDSAGNAAADRLGHAVGAVGWDSTLPGRICVRMVTAFDTTEVEIEAAVSAL